MTRPNQPKINLFRSAIALRDVISANEILQSAIAAKYPERLTAYMKSQLSEINSNSQEDRTPAKKKSLTHSRSLTKAAVVCHCYYLDIWPEISNRLEALNCHFDLFVTTTNDRISEVSEQVTASFADARFFAAPNKGMDIIPFLTILPLLHGEGYEYVCKLQTKKGDGRLAIIWRDLMLDTLIGSCKNFSSAIQAFEEDDNLTMVGPGPLYQSAHMLMLNNKAFIEEITQKTWGHENPSSNDWGFFAGTMFWSRIKPLLPLSQQYNIGCGDAGTKYQQDGKIEHGLERIFGLAATIESGNIGLMYPTSQGLLDQRVIKYFDKEGIGVAHIGTIMRAIEDFDNSKKLIENSKLFNSTQYINNCPELAGSEIDFIFHYLTTGTFKNYWPCSDVSATYTLQKEAMQSDSHSDVLVYICDQLNNGKSLRDLQSPHASSPEYGPKEASIITSSGLFDEDFYLQQRPDLRGSSVSPIDHYLAQGVYDECYPNKYFVPREYLALNKDVADANMEPFTHYLTHGCIENRRYRETFLREKENSPFLRYQALNERLIDWDNVGRKLRDPDLISIVIPIFNNSDLTLSCISSIVSAKTSLKYEIICVDNGSDHSTKKALLDCSNKYGFRIVENDENYNFALGCNIGFASASGDIIVFLNNDTRVTDNWLDELVKPLDDLSIKAVQPRLLFPDLTVQCIGVVFALNQIIGYPIYSGIDSGDAVAKKSRRLKAITAACMAVRANDFAAVRGFDPIFINGQEDIDLCLRLCQSSVDSSCYCQATSSVVHYESKTPGRGEHIKLNRVNFANRWRSKISGDDFVYYSDDRFEIVGWNRDSKEFLELDVGASRPILKKSLISRVRYNWDTPAEGHFIESISNYYSHHATIIDATFVTIVMPTRNRASIISRAIQSVLDQTHSNFELLIIDDGSTDETRHVVSGFLDDSRVSIKTIKYSGVSIARNTGLDMSAGQFIAYLDSDNFWESNFLRVMISFLIKEDLFASYSGIRALDNEGRASKFRGDAFLWDECLIENYIDINAFIHRTTPIRNDENLRRLVDWDFILRITKSENTSFAPFVGVNYYDGSKYHRITNTVSVSQEDLSNLQYYVRAKHAKDQPTYNATTYNSPKDVLAIDSMREFQVSIKTPCPSILESQEWGDYHLACSLSKALYQLGINSQVHTLDSWPSCSDSKNVVIVIRGLSQYIPRPQDYNILWIISHPEKINADELARYDYIFVASSFYARIVKKLTNKPVSVLLQATDPVRFNPNLSRVDADKLLFVGNSRQVFRPIVKHLVETGRNISIYGNHWEEFIDSTFIKGRNILNSELGAYYAGADVVFNDHWDSMASNGFISNRIFDCVACATFVISDYVEGIDKIFGSSVFQYKHVSQIDLMLNSKVDWPSKQDLMEASSHIIENHTFHNRAIEVLNAVRHDCAGKILSSKTI